LEKTYIFGTNTHSMLFTNPNIIQDIDDLIIGGVEVEGDKIDYLNYVTKVKKRILRMVVKQVKDSMSNGATHLSALQETADTVYSYLQFNEKQYPLNEEQLVDEILNSIEYKSWESEVYYNFLNIHSGVIQTNTPVEAGGTKPELADSYNLAEEQDFFDLLQALSSAFNL
jgi:hypothetical protein